MLDSCADLLIVFWFLNVQYPHWFPAGPVDMQRYLPAAGSAGLVTGSAGATCAGFYKDQRQPAGPVAIPAVCACG